MDLIPADYILYWGKRRMPETFALILRATPDLKKPQHVDSISKHAKSRTPTMRSHYRSLERRGVFHTVGKKVVNEAYTNGKEPKNRRYDTDAYIPLTRG